MGTGIENCFAIYRRQWLEWYGVLGWIWKLHRHMLEFRVEIIECIEKFAFQLLTCWRRIACGNAFVFNIHYVNSLCKIKLENDVN